VNWYRLLLRAYPAAFRDRFGRDLEELFDDLYRSRARGLSRRRLAVFWYRIAADTIRSGLAELVQLSLAKAEAKDEWSLLEERWDRVQDELKRTGAQSQGTIKESVRTLLDDLKSGYERIRTQLKEPASQQ
jgi:hypothetical protein